HAWQADQQMGAVGGQWFGNFPRLAHSVERDLGMNSNGAKRTTKELGVLRIPAPLPADSRDALVQPQPERVIGPLAEEHVVALLQRGTPDHERLTGRAAGSNGDQAGRT